MGIINAVALAVTSDRHLLPKITTSKHYKHWLTLEDSRRCLKCEKNHGKIWMITETPDLKPPLHPNCRCMIALMQAIAAGTATINGINGADWKLKYERILPDYYIAREDLKGLGWRQGEQPARYIEGKMVFGGVYKNYNGHLPQANGRLWYEADINYISGKRNPQRILWSNDGLIFVTYDHYETFYEIN